MGCEMGPEEVHMIAECLPYTSLKSLQLGGNQFGSEGLVHLARKLSESLVDELGLEGTGIEAKCQGLSELAKAWAQRPFSRLRLNDNPMGMDEVKHFVQTLRTLRA